MENPFFDRIVIPEKEDHLEEPIHNYLIEDVRTIGGKPIEDFEIAKTDIDKKIIGYVSHWADKALEKYGRTKVISVPLENVHLMNPGGVNEFTDGEVDVGAHAAIMRSILIDRDESDLQFATILFHEMMHLKCYTALQVIVEPDDVKVAEYRLGFSVASRDGKTIYLNSVEEAIIGYLTAEFVDSVRKRNSFLADKKDETIEVGREMELEKLNSAVDDIYQKNQDVFTSSKDVMNAFIDGQVNGNLLKITKAVEKDLRIW